MIPLVTFVAALDASPAPPAPLPSPAAVVAPPASPPPVPVTPAPLPEPSPTAWPFKFRFVPHVPANPAAGEPVIYAVYLNDDHLRSHKPIMIRVETNDAVTKVETGANGRSGNLPMIEPRVFYATSILPNVPFIAAGMTMQFKVVGTTAAGRKVTVVFPVKLD